MLLELLTISLVLLYKIEVLFVFWDFYSTCQNLKFQKNQSDHLDVQSNFENCICLYTLRCLSLIVVAITSCHIFTAILLSEHLLVMTILVSSSYGHRERFHDIGHLLMPKSQ